MDSPSTFSEEIHRAKWVARMPPISAMTAASRRGIRRSVFSRRRTPPRTRIVAPMMSVAVPRRDSKQRWGGGGCGRARGPVQRRGERGRRARAEVDRIPPKIRGVAPLREAGDGAQLVSGAVFEKMEIKKELYADRARICPP